MQEPYSIRTDISKADGQLVLDCALEAFSAIRRFGKGRDVNAISGMMCQANTVCMTLIFPKVGFSSHDRASCENLPGTYLLCTKDVRPKHSERCTEITQTPKQALALRMFL